jgi:hypothetical protein
MDILAHLVVRVGAPLVLHEAKAVLLHDGIFVAAYGSGGGQTDHAALPGGAGTYILRCQQHAGTQQPSQRLERGGWLLQVPTVSVYGRIEDPKRVEKRANRCTGELQYMCGPAEGPDGGVHKLERQALELAAQ